MKRHNPPNPIDAGEAPDAMPADLRDLRTDDSTFDDEGSGLLYSQGARQEMDGDLRHRRISEAAYRIYAERGFVDGFEAEDWRQAEAEADGLSGSDNADK